MLRFVVEIGRKRNAGGGSGNANSDFQMLKTRAVAIPALLHETRRKTVTISRKVVERAEK
jgi:hypothetical protein